MFYHCLFQNLTILDHSHFCPKRWVPQTSIVISCQFVNISKGNNTIDIAFFSFLYVLYCDRNVRNAEQDKRVADFDNFCDAQISPMRGHPFTRNVRNAEQDNRVADLDNFCDEQISSMRGHPLQTTLLTHLDHSHFCPKRGVPQTSIVISCQFVTISKGNSTIDIAFFPCYMFYIMIEMCEMLNKIPCCRFWQFLWRTDFPYVWPPLYPKCAKCWTR